MQSSANNLTDEVILSIKSLIKIRKAKDQIQYLVVVVVVELQQAPEDDPQKR